MVDAKGRADLLNQKEAAHFLKVHRSTLHGWIKSGRLSKADAYTREELLLAKRNLPPSQAKRLKGDATPDATPDTPATSEEVAPTEPNATELAPERPDATDATKTDPAPATDPPPRRVRLAENPEDLELPTMSDKPKTDPKTAATPETPKVTTKVEAEKKAPAVEAAKEASEPWTFFDHLADEPKSA